MSAASSARGSRAARVVGVRLALLALAPLTFLALPALAQETRPVDVPLRLDPAFLRTLLVQQIYTASGETVDVWQDSIGCNRLVLASPRVYGREGRLRVLTESAARIGTPLGDTCTLPVEVKHQVEVMLAPEVTPGSSVVRFRVVDSNVLEETGHRLSATGILWSWVKDYVHPRLAAFEVDLAPPLQDLRDFLPHVLEGDDAARTRAVLDSVRLQSAVVTDAGLVATLRFDAPVVTAEPTPGGQAPEAPLTPEERTRLVSELKRWDAFLTFVVKAAGADSEGRTARQELLDVLLDARQELVKSLEATERADATAPSRAEDPVRALFLSTWARLAPVVQRLPGALPGETALRYLGFLAAGDALAALERIGGGSGVEVSADGLRRLARTIAPGTASDPLSYDDRVDPELRETFGFGPPIDPPAAADESPPGESPVEPGAAPPDSGRIELPWLFVQPAVLRSAVPLPPTALVKRLNVWIPDRDELEDYLEAMRELLRDAGEAALASSDLGERFHVIYRWLVLATAWQESCWRQFVRVAGKREPLTSSAGAVGVMQVNVRVWRGFYEPNGLRYDVGYNARAGSEILLHYFQDYAIARSEHLKTGREDFVARATYAVYNGGPGHLERYRKPKTPKSLRRIDDAFWRKYQAVKAGRELDVAQCWGS